MSIYRQNQVEDICEVFHIPTFFEPLHDALPVIQIRSKAVVIFRELVENMADGSIDLVHDTSDPSLIQFCSGYRTDPGHAFHNTRIFRNLRTF